MQACEHPVIHPLGANEGGTRFGGLQVAKQLPSTSTSALQAHQTT